MGRSFYSLSSILVTPLKEAEGAQKAEKKGIPPWGEKLYDVQLRWEGGEVATGGNVCFLGGDDPAFGEKDHGLP